MEASFYGSRIHLSHWCYRQSCRRPSRCILSPILGRIGPGLDQDTRSGVEHCYRHVPHHCLRDGAIGDFHEEDSHLKVFDVLGWFSEVYIPWNDSTIVLSWLSGNPRLFKTYVGNHVSEIIYQIPPDRWSHVINADNPAVSHHNCSTTNSGGLVLHLEPSKWPKQESTSVEPPVE